MNSTVEVTVAAATPILFTTVARIKRELDINVTGQDNLLRDKIEEASADIQHALRFTVARETVSETFWPDHGRTACEQELILDRTPVSSIDSVIVDGDTVSSTEYRLRAGAGLLYRLDSGGSQSLWRFTNSAVVVYSGGYLLPGSGGADLDPAIESACIDLLRSFWFSRLRDPLVKSEEVAGVARFDYWVGGVGTASELPPEVMRKLAPLRRIVAA